MKERPADSHKMNTEAYQDRNNYLDELAEIKAEISSLNRAVSRVLEHSGNQQMNMMFSDIKNDLSGPLINYMMHDARNTLNNSMPEDCEQKQVCKSAFEKLFQEMSLLLLDRNMDEEKLLQFQERFDELKEFASTENCDSCTTHASTMFNKQLGLLRTMSGSVGQRSETGDATSIVDLPDDVVSSICEPLANKQRLLILKSLSTETRSFSELSKITGLRGGNLLFHLQKLLDTDMILQRTERGDYLLTNKGYRILQGIADLYEATEKVSGEQILLESDQVIG
ncbi:winged helix-turn-helix transcriptional regulator [Methanolobus zinderi]|jgi:DNA-binding HxlR family transcriptional regulator|uniref:Winged helix-turn-helix transcriptional regulator n=1 Tax=Methanolobus zinderi TaxID=536044 RepID=A0A7D5I8J6_9EURY|nr:winged helix-turn-helix domain-containing protein [Methanolobus zinderi]KXS41783.1 MAG: ArsR family transcriptional regulator [Methanolobus sp. T82-4]QLC49862.1 winged helix-turn-helix transcriptional regulator [Methanolobus zinderi]